MSDGLSLAPLASWAVWFTLPLMLVACTSFTKISIVLAALRVGMGAQELLPSLVMYALALLLTVLSMGAVWPGAIEGVLAASSDSRAVSWADAINALTPVLEFARANAPSSTAVELSELSGWPADHGIVVVSAFMLSELAAGVEAAVYMLLPFLLVDLGVAQVLALLGLQVSPGMITLPLKLIVFTAAGGWQLVAEGLIRGYSG